MPDAPTVQGVLVEAERQLRERGVDTPRLDAELLVGHALGIDRVGLRVRADEPAADEQAVRALVARRAAGEPLQYILGTAPFRNLTLRVDERVLIPRPETELLVEWVLEQLSRTRARARVVDICTGSGAVALAVADEAGPDRAAVAGADISPEALDVAAANARELGLDVEWVRSDLLADVPGPIDLITANPPYVLRDDAPTLAPEVRDHEPHLALFLPGDGSDPTHLVRRIAAQARERLTPGGGVAIEVGMGQHDAVASVLRGAGFDHVEPRDDLQGIPRIVTGRLG